MSCTQDEMKKAVECGYWHLYRYDPRRIAEGKNPFQLDSPAPDTDKLMDFLMGENRFASLKNNFPERADALYQKEIADVKAPVPEVPQDGGGLISEGTDQIDARRRLRRRERSRCGHSCPRRFCGERRERCI